MTYEWTSQRIAIGVWVAFLAALFVTLAYPIGIGVLRLFVAVTVPLLWMSAIVLTRQRKPLAIALTALGLVVLGIMALPGRPVDSERLRHIYVQELRQYEGAPYVWGGENRRGIDCSGLVRRALINAQIRLAFATLNPRPMRSALALWWHDCSALALSEQYRDFTTNLVRVASANSVQEPELLPGDIGITAGGVHVLAYLGNREWIQAEPGLLKVVVLRAPSENGWMNHPLKIMRWTMMAETANQVLQGTSRSRAVP